MKSQKDNTLNQLELVRQESLDKDSLLKGLEQAKQALEKQSLEHESTVNFFLDQLEAKAEELERVRKEKEGLLLERDKLVFDTSSKIAELKAARDKIQKELFKEIENHEMELKLAKGRIVVSVLTDILFKSGSDSIELLRMPLLNKISEVIKNNIKDYQIVVEGHTDNEPIKYSGWKSNWELSCARALSVMHYFADRCHLIPERLSINAYGEFKPIASNETELGRKKNRRVEIIVFPAKIIKVRSDAE